MDLSLQHVVEFNRVALHRGIYWLAGELHSFAVGIDRGRAQPETTEVGCAVSSSRVSPVAFALRANRLVKSALFS